MEWFLGLFLITSVWALWVVPIVFFFIILAFAENEKNFFAGVSLLIFAAIMYHSNYLVLTDPWLIAKYFGYYFVAGAGWSIMKWYFYLTEKANNFKGHKVKFIKQANRRNKEYGDTEPLEPSFKTEIPENMMKAYKEFLVEHSGHQYSNRFQYAEEMSVHDIVIPSAAENKEKITTWILWWPTSAFWTILNDPLVKLANAIYDRFQGIYSRISNMVFKDVGL